MRTKFKISKSLRLIRRVKKKRIKWLTMGLRLLFYIILRSTEVEKPTEAEITWKDSSDLEASVVGCEVKPPLNTPKEEV